MKKVFITGRGKGIGRALAEKFLSPSLAAADIFKLAISHPETGQFWHKGEKYPW